ncbi:hypothetical protein CC2G_014393 [Coprinopsis cinerea AmutBmut pab1-1]|nr:hypothetical protein CC2G_014393 [Coprinopsis cinerea AmutBmut pab1-1]
MLPAGLACPTLTDRETQYSESYLPRHTSLMIRWLIIKSADWLNYGHPRQSHRAQRGPTLTVTLLPSSSAVSTRTSMTSTSMRE